MGDHLVDGLFGCKEQDITIVITTTIVNYMAALL